MKLKVNVTSKRFGGGGGTTTTTREVETIPEWARPYLERVGQTAEAKYTEGALGRVAGASDIQQQAFGMSPDIGSIAAVNRSLMQESQDRMRGLAETGGRDALMESAAYNAAKQRAGMDREAGAAGTLGSARTSLAQAAMEAELADKATQQSIENRMRAEQGIGAAADLAQRSVTGAASSLANLGDIQRGVSQQELDTDWQALERYASTIFGSPARQSAVQESSGGK
jgi:hypothetical protein